MDLKGIYAIEHKIMNTLEFSGNWVRGGCGLSPNFAPFSISAIMISGCYFQKSNGGFDRIHERLLTLL